MCSATLLPEPDNPLTMTRRMAARLMLTYEDCNLEDYSGQQGAGNDRSETVPAALIQGPRTVKSPGAIALSDHDGRVFCASSARWSESFSLCFLTRRSSLSASASIAAYMSISTASA